VADKKEEERKLSIIVYGGWVGATVDGSGTEKGQRRGKMEVI